jgi:hypothetical protein
VVHIGWLVIKGKECLIVFLVAGAVDEFFGGFILAILVGFLWCYAFTS